MSGPLLRRLAAWTVASAATALTTTWLVPVALAPGDRFDESLTRICAGVAVLVVVGLWVATAVVVVATTRATT